MGRHGAGRPPDPARSVRLHLTLIRQRSGPRPVASLVPAMPWLCPAGRGPCPPARGPTGLGGPGQLAQAKLGPGTWSNFCTQITGLRETRFHSGNLVADGTGLPSRRHALKSLALVAGFAAGGAGCGEEGSADADRADPPHHRSGLHSLASRRLRRPMRPSGASGPQR